jgi:hypothetical protein
MTKQQIIKYLSNKDAYGRGSFKHFIQVSNTKNKKHISKYIDQVETMTDHQIDRLRIPKWMTTHLHSLKKEIIARPDGALTPEEIAEKMSNHNASI